MDYNDADKFAGLLGASRDLRTGIALKVYDLGVHESLDAYGEAIRGLPDVDDNEFGGRYLARLGELMAEVRSGIGVELARDRLEIRHGTSQLEKTGAIVSAEFYCLGVNAFVGANEVYPIPRDVEDVEAVRREYDHLTRKPKSE